jgi:hypothetical protein
MFAFAAEQTRRDAAPPRPAPAAKPSAAPAPDATLWNRIAMTARSDPRENAAERAADQVSAGRPLHAGCTCGGTCPRCRAIKQQVAMRAPGSTGPRAPSLELARASAERASAAAPAASAGTAALPGIVSHALRRPGAPLDARTRERLEPRFGADLGHVRVHTDALASRSAAAVGARAYTVGSHVAFHRGEFAPETPHGLHLLAHELAHVLQQTGGGGAADGEGELQAAANPALIAALAILAATALCAWPFYSYAMSHYGSRTDKYRHCWVSCQMAKTCGPILTELAGLGKEMRDRAVAAYCDHYPSSPVCHGGHGDFWDSVGDLRANQMCIAWEAVVVGPLARLWRESCEDCCNHAGV